MLKNYFIAVHKTYTVVGTHVVFSAGVFGDVTQRTPHCMTSQKMAAEEIMGNEMSDGFQVKRHVNNLPIH